MSRLKMYGKIKPQSQAEKVIAEYRRWQSLVYRIKGGYKKIKTRKTRRRD